jgi:glyoxylase-like metal-dependent hydrolase (beta-lactamase superfamily II)/rhodanese-related sulfurtransferase
MGTIGFRQLFDYDTWTYTYLLWDQDTKEAVIIDPVREQYLRDLEAVTDLQLKLLYALDTHVHADHVTALGMFRDSMGAQTAVGKPARVGCADILLEDGQELQFGKHTLKALATPGHTDACTSYQVENMVFTGDAILIRGCGRTDFQQGSPENLYRSIHEKIFSLPDETLIYPGHDYRGRLVTSVGEEKRLNPRLKTDNSFEDFNRIMNNLNLPYPKRIDESLPANLDCGVTEEQGSETVCTMEEIKHLSENPSEDVLLVDVRTPQEYGNGHVQGSINIPLGDEAQYLDKFKTYEKVYLFCRSGRRARYATSSLNNKGLENIICVPTTGMLHWDQAGYPVN